jgi:shikimate kinase
MALCEKILIVGFSGAGKSSLIRSLRASPPEGWEHFDDLDALVLRNRGRGLKSISELIEVHGWEKFRLWERQEIEGWLKEEGKGVLALGGGAFTPLLFELFSKSRKIKFCHLEVSFETAWGRLQNSETEERPLVKEGKESLRKVFEERSKYFALVEWRVNANQLAEKVWADFLSGLL